MPVFLWKYQIVCRSDTNNLLLLHQWHLLTCEYFQLVFVPEEWSPDEVDIYSQALIETNKDFNVVAKKASVFISYLFSIEANRNVDSWS